MRKFQHAVANHPLGVPSLTPLTVLYQHAKYYQNIKVKILTSDSEDIQICKNQAI